MRSFLKALRIVEKLNEMAASADSSTTGGAFCVTHLFKEVLSSAIPHDVLLYITAVAAHT